MLGASEHAGRNACNASTGEWSKIESKGTLDSNFQSWFLTAGGSVNGHLHSNCLPAQELSGLPLFRAQGPWPSCLPCLWLLLTRKKLHRRHMTGFKTLLLEEKKEQTPDRPRCECAGPREEVK